ncbi:MAG: alanine racemase [Desulfobulbaceae bacterium]|nr:alanine racemase [Desulfobulbaceae bacterium]
MTKNISRPAGAGKISLSLEQNTPLLPDHELRPFVEHFFARRMEYLALLEKYPPPLYVLDTGVLRARAREFRDAFRAVLPDVRCYYAVKSNNHPDIAGTLLQCGMGLDVSSGVELEMAVGLDAGDVIFSGPGKTDAELRLAVWEADRVTVLIDSFGELSRLDVISREHGRTVRVGVRLTTNPNGLWRKFGILPDQLALFWEKVRKCGYLRFEGLQFHTSWNLSPDAQVTFIKQLGKILRKLPAAALAQIKFIDMGGGYWPPQGEWLQAAGTTTGRLKKEMGLEQPGAEREHYRLPSQPIEQFAGQLSRAVRTHILSIVPCRICLEPGRWLCNDAMHLLLSVVDKKCDDLVITDAGTNTIGWERFETDYFPILNLSRPGVKEKSCHILGALCTPHDVWGYNYWGEDIRVGDILMIPTQGAYTYSLRQNFIKPLPAVISIDSDRFSQGLPPVQI